MYGLSYPHVRTCLRCGAPLATKSRWCPACRRLWHTGPPRLWPVPDDPLLAALEAQLSRLLAGVLAEVH